MKSKKIYEQKNLEFFSPETSTAMDIPLAEFPVSAGFPSPADDYVENTLDLNKHLIKNSSATFFARVKGESMIEAGISDGDLLIIDRSLEPKANSVVICFLDGEFTVKKVKKVDKNTIYLMPENPGFEPIKVTRDNYLLIWGVVTYAIHQYH